MRSFSHPVLIDDLATLDALTTGIPFLYGCFPVIENAYKAYVNCAGSPQLKAVGLSLGQTVCLHKAYDGGAKKIWARLDSETQGCLDLVLSDVWEFNGRDGRALSAKNAFS